MKKKLGQHFLIDEEILRREVEYASVKGEKVLEIGAGDGRLTELLLGQGAKVTAVEKDRELVELLERKFAGNANVNIVHADFLRLEPEKFGVIIGNIPYYISSPILFKLKEYEFDRALLCVQKEFAERLAASPGGREYSRLTVMANIYFEMQLLEEVPSSAFSPPPKVDSAIVFLRKTGMGCAPFAGKLIAALFQHRKKTVKNALLVSRSSFGKEKAEMAELAKKVKKGDRRVFTLGIDELLEIAKEVERLVSC